MSYTDNPLNPIDRVRLKIGDTENPPLITDAWYGYYLDLGYTENAVALELAKRILTQYAHSGAREMEGQVQVYGAERFGSYLKWLKDLVTNGLTSPAMPYAGGISLSDMRDNDANLDNVRPFRRYNHEDYF